MAGWLTKAFWNTFTLWHARDEERLPYRSMDELLALQSRRVQAIVARAYATVPYYQEVFDAGGWRPEDFRTAADLTRLPLLTSADLIAAPERFLSRAYAERGLEIQSSGTTGRAKFLRHDPASLFLALAHGHRERVVLGHFTGRRLGYREMSVTRPASVTLQIRAFYEAHSWVPRAMDFRRLRLPAEERFEAAVARINAFEPDVIRGYGSHLGALFRWAYEQRLPVFRPKAILYGADAMPPAHRALIEQKLRIPVLSSYQAVEALRLGFECEQRAGFHLHIDDVAFWVRGADGRPVEPGGRGDLVIANLTNRATVLLNYKLGDVVTLGRTPCPCGRTLPLIEELAGRSDDAVVLPDGQIRHALVVLHQLRAISGVVQVQVVQEELRRFLVRIVCAAGTDWDMTCEDVTRVMRGMCGDDVLVVCERRAMIPPEPGGKVRALISRCRGTAPAPSHP